MWKEVVRELIWLKRTSHDVLSIDKKWITSLFRNINTDYILILTKGEKRFESLKTKNRRIGVASHILKFGDASKSLAADAVVFHWRSMSPLEMRILRTHIHISCRRHRTSRERCVRISKLRDMWQCWRIDV